MTYYYPKGTNPNWIEGWGERMYVDDVLCWRNNLDAMVYNACGIEYGGISDHCQRHAQHTYAHILAAFYAGLEVAKAGDIEDIQKQILESVK